MKKERKKMEGGFCSGTCNGGGWKDIRGFILQVLLGRWFMVFASLLIMCVAGTSYMFGLYSNDIKSTLGYDQTTLNLLVFFEDLGGNLGILSGLIYEVVPPWVVLSIGAVMNFLSYFVIWLTVAGRNAKPHVWQMCLYTFIGANSESFPNTGALSTCVNNFPESRGSVLGLLKGFYWSKWCYYHTALPCFLWRQLEGCHLANCLASTHHLLGFSSSNPGHENCSTTK